MYTDNILHTLNIPIHCDEIRKNMRILNIEDQLKFQISSLMWDYDNNDLPEHLSKYFERTNLVHNYETRGAGSFLSISSAIR